MMCTGTPVVWHLVWTVSAAGSSFNFYFFKFFDHGNSQNYEIKKIKVKRSKITRMNLYWNIYK